MSEAMSDVPQWKEDAYQAVWRSGLLTRDAFANARMWRAVEVALGAAENSLREAQ